jgi:hypothetical protein
MAFVLVLVTMLNARDSHPDLEDRRRLLYPCQSGRVPG